MERDTAPEVLARYRARLAAMTPAERLEIAAGLTEGVRALAEAGLRKRYPGASGDELRCRLAALLYGRETALRLFRDVPADVR
jgi:hypothetical protein